MTQQSTMTPTDCIAASERLFRQVRREFIAGFAETLRQHGVPVEAIHRGTLAYWADPGPTLGGVAVRPYSEPLPRDTGRPLITRIHLNDYPTPVPDTVCRRLGTEPVGYVQFSWDDKLELSVLPSELADFGLWVAHLVYARREPSFPLPDPPHALLCPNASWAGRDLRQSGYEWSQAANRVYSAWSEVDEQRRRKWREWRQARAQAAQGV